MTDSATGTAECTAGPTPRGSGPQRLLTRSILWYQRAREGRPSPCRFFPSCSAYALEAVEVHGSRHGTWLAVKRLVRCRPLGPSGFDPVPDFDDGLAPTCAHEPATTPDVTTGHR